MNIDQIKAGILVMISSLIESELDGIERRQGAIGMVDSPVMGTGGLWWWIVHQDGRQIKYRYCEISEIKTIRVPNNIKLEISEKNEEKMDKPTFLRDNDRGEELSRTEWVHGVVEKWID